MGEIKKEYGKSLLYLIGLGSDNIYATKTFLWFSLKLLIAQKRFFKTVYLIFIYKIDDKEEGINLLWINRFFCLK